MSTYYRPTEPIPLQKIIKSKGLKKLGLEVIEDDNGTYFHLEGDYIHYATDNENNVIDLFRYGRNNADNILDPLLDEFGIDFISEYDEEFYDNLRHENTPVIQISLDSLKEIK